MKNVKNASQHIPVIMLNVEGLFTQKIKLPVTIDTKLNYDENGDGDATI